jgi:hypothetical protein
MDSNRKVRRAPYGKTCSGQVEILRLPLNGGTQQPVGAQLGAMVGVSGDADCMVLLLFIRGHSSSARLNISRFQTNRRSQPKKDGEESRVDRRSAGVSADCPEVLASAPFSF